MISSVDFALGRADVRLLPWNYNYRGGRGFIGAGVVWHVEDIKTRHQDFVGEKWLAPRA